MKTLRGWIGVILMYLVGHPVTFVSLALMYLSFGFIDGRGAALDVLRVIAWIGGVYDDNMKEALKDENVL